MRKCADVFRITRNTGRRRAVFWHMVECSAAGFVAAVGVPDSSLYCVKIKAK